MVGIVVIIRPPDGLQPNQAHPTLPMVLGWSGAKRIGGGNATGHEISHSRRPSARFIVGDTEKNTPWDSTRLNSPYCNLQVGDLIS